jgi:predicted nucleic acid-binding protein
MILVDTGPFVALFDPQDAEHEHCQTILRATRAPLFTTLPVLTEAFHLLRPNSIGADRLRDFLLAGGARVWFMDKDTTTRAFELMEQYGDHPMDLADASLIVAAEALRTTTVFTLDLTDFQRYRIRRGHRHVTVEILH